MAITSNPRLILAIAAIVLLIPMVAFAEADPLDRLNAKIEPHGGHDNEARLSKLIDDTPLPKADPKAFPVPPDFPQFKLQEGIEINASVDETAVHVWDNYPNHELWKRLTLLNSDQVRAELERRMEMAGDPFLKLYIAALACRVGGRGAGHYILKQMLDTDYETVRNVQDALKIALTECKTVPPDWIVEMAMASMSDNRFVTGLEKARMQWPGLTIAIHADVGARMAWDLAKCHRAVPLLIDMAKSKTASQFTIEALGETADPRAIATLLEVLHRTEDQLSFQDTTIEIFDAAATSAAKLNAKDAVPILLKHPCDKEILVAIESLGDKAAIPVLEKILADNKPPTITGRTAERDKYAVDAARIALATLKDGDPIPRYCDLLADQSLGEFARCDVLDRLRRHPDVRAVPSLLRAIKSDPSASVSEWSIRQLANFKRKDAVKGLIDCFSVDFSAKSGGQKGGTTPEMFAEEIGRSLKAVTGQNFGSDQAKWRKWWDEQGSRSTALQ